MRLALLLISSLVVSPASASGQDGSSASEAIESELAKISELMEKSKWSRAKRELRDLLNEYADSRAMLVRWPRVSEALQLCTFWDHYELPDAEDVIPEIVSWRESSGKLKLRYDRGDEGLAAAAEGGGFGDFIRIEEGLELFVHPMRFTGPYAIKLEGRELSRSDFPTVWVDWLWGSLRGLGYGTTYVATFGDTFRVSAVEDSRLRVLEYERHEMQYGRPYEFEVRVKDGAVSLLYNRKTVLRVPREEGPFGQFGLTKLDVFEQVEISGEVDPAWIAGAIDSQLVADWNQFVDGYDVVGDAPPTLRERIEGSARRARDLIEVAPGEIDKVTGRSLKKARKYYEDEEFEEGLVFVQDLSDDDITHEARDWMLALFYALNGESERSLKRCEQVAEFDPRFYEARLMLARLRYSQQSRFDSLAEHEALVADFNDYVEPYEALAEVHLYGGDLERAEDVLGLAADNGLPMGELKRIGRTLTRARVGPVWHDSHSYSTQSYVVHSNSSKEVCLRVATELEESFRRYQAQLGRIEGEFEPFPVYYFAGHAGYEAYCADPLGRAPRTTPPACSTPPSSSSWCGPRPTPSPRCAPCATRASTSTSIGSSATRRCGSTRAWRSTTSRPASCGDAGRTTS